MPFEQTSLGPFALVASKAAESLQKNDVVGRIWRQDHTVWSADPTGISNRLGWLSVNEEMRAQAQALREFASEVRASGIEHVVSLAMGGSALAPEVYRATWGVAPGYPTFTMLDSTVPAWVQAVTQAIEPAKTLFIVASKSGSTIEVLSFYRYFRDLLDRRLGRQEASAHFIAITDQGTPLEEMARKESFLRIFLNPSNVGGRFSGLSLFGLVPAALMGVDLDRFLASIEAMRQRCGPSAPPQDNPGAWLGAVMGSLALEGVDKLTLVTSPALARFGLWIDQMLAESLGKDGKGIIPIAGEPLVSAETYGNDRFFVYIQLEGDQETAIATHRESMQAAGHVTITLNMTSRDDLAGELFRWGFATTVAGHVLGMNPFDQPNVQRAQAMALEELRAYERDGVLPTVETSSSVASLLAQAQPGDYLALLAFLPQSPQVDDILLRIRLAVLRRYHIATTAGYGPRYLHSAGQLHKSGPNTGLFLQLVADTGDDLPIPGERYSFGILAGAQAQSDIRALQHQNRRVARHRLTGEYLPALEALAHSIEIT